MALQTIIFCFGQLEHEIFWETINISFHLSVHLLYFNLINIRQVSINKHLLTPDRNDKFLDIMLVKRYFALFEVVTICDRLILEASPYPEIPE